ncbi:MAG: lipopolysaccharide biosynthesis protein [Alphaproteobacteria bacterium]
MQSSGEAVLISDGPGPWRRGVATLRRWFAEGFFRRVFRNAGVLLGGKAASGLFGLGALALTARALGPELFGVLVLIHTYTQIVAGLTTFQSWQAVIRYGAVCLEDDRRGDFQGLIKYTVLLDLGGAVGGAAIAAACAPTVGAWLGWSGDATSLAVFYSVAILFTVKAMPTGVLRLFNRFDALAVQMAVAPAVRLAGAAVAYAVGGGLWAFLAAWLVAGAAGSLTLVVMGWRELARRGLTRGMRLSLKGATKPHPGLWRFVWSTNLQSSVAAATGQLGTVTVGWILGPAAAGLYKIASQIANVLITPSGLLQRSIYPELARLSAQGGRRVLWRAVARAGLLAGSVAALAVPVLAVAGEPLIRLIAGAEYVDAYGVLVLLALAATVSIYGFALEPVMFAMGKPGTLLRVTVVVAVCYFLALVILLRTMGLAGAGIAAVASTTAWSATVAVIAFRLLSRPEALRPEKRP